MSCLWVWLLYANPASSEPKSQPTSFMRLLYSGQLSTYPNYPKARYQLLCPGKLFKLANNKPTGPAPQSLPMETAIKTLARMSLSFHPSPEQPWWFPVWPSVVCMPLFLRICGYENFFHGSHFCVCVSCCSVTKLCPTLCDLMDCSCPSLSPRI